MIVFSFLLFLVLFLVIGALSVRAAKRTSDDYLLANREVHPWLAALSAVATNNSGFMFVGLIGSTYVVGISTVWIGLGWVVGDYVVWRWFAKRIRTVSAQSNTVPHLIAGTGPGAGGLRILAALVVFLFLSAYAAAQLKAGSKALFVLFDWPMWVGAVVGAGIIFLYCYSGGLRASIWTDAAQSMVMITSMFLLLGTALIETGGLSGLFRTLEAIDPKLLLWMPPDLPWGFGIFALGWLAAGFGVVGQPHIVIRLMAIKSPEAIDQARRIYMTWDALFWAAAILVGLCCRVLLDGESFDEELALPILSKQLLPPFVVGIMLAGLFAATMSTADSQVLSCAAAITQDIYPPLGRSYAGTKAGTVVVSLMVLGIALFASETGVFQLVTFAWSVLASALGPLIVLRALSRPVIPRVGYAMILVGLATAILWSVAGLSNATYEVLPGMASGFAIWGLSQLQRRWVIVRSA